MPGRPVSPSSVPVGVARWLTSHRVSYTSNPPTLLLCLSLPDQFLLRMAYHTTSAKRSNPFAMNPAVTSSSAAPSPTSEELPENRFELELEFVQALASPAYLHFLATYREGNGPVLLQDPQFLAYLKYLHKTWTQPDYARFLLYPHALFFLELLCQDDTSTPGHADAATVAREWSQPAFRDFCHQQQFLAWQHRHSILYGGGNQLSSDNGDADLDATMPT